MGILSGISHALSDPLGYLHDRADSVADWFTGSSTSRRGFNRQMELQAMSQGFNAREAEKSHERSKELAALQQQYTKDYFDYVSAYNTPINQMERLREAGLNPNLVYGNGAMAVQAATPQSHAPGGAQASGSGVGSASGGIPQSLGSVLGGIRDALGTYRDIKSAQLMDSQIKREEASAALTDAQRKGQELANVLKSRDQMFGSGRVGRFLGDLYRTALTAKTMFPEQYDMVRKWADQKIKKFFDDSPAVLDRVRSFLSRPPSSGGTSPTIINQHFGSLGAGTGYIPEGWRK